MRLSELTMPKGKHGEEHNGAKLTWAQVAEIRKSRFLVEMSL